jgi:2,3-diketo-5-methylthio-1-phosphopentane phosphatase
VLIDFDGTISALDVGDELIARHAPDQRLVREKDALYDRGVIGSRELMRWDMDVLPRDADLLRREAADLPLDPTVVDLVDVVRGAGGVVEVVSDGMGFYIEDHLRRLGLGDLPVATNANRVTGGGAGMSFPYGHPRCFVCGTCKRERVRLHRAAGRVTLLVGDGTSDRYAAPHADLVFAKRSLARHCLQLGVPFEPWERLVDVAEFVRDALSDGRLPRDRRAFEAWVAGPGRRDERFICGPEVWGAGRTTPLAPVRSVVSS